MFVFDTDPVILVAMSVSQLWLNQFFFNHVSIKMPINVGVPTNESVTSF